MNLSDQAVGALMMALQKSLMEQSDIVPVLRGFKFVVAKDGELVVEYTDGFDYPRYMVYHETDDSNEIVAEFDSRYFDAGMVQLITDYLKTR